MSREKFFMITTVVLLLLNTAAMVFFFTTQSRPGFDAGKGQTGDYIVKTLRLSSEQQAQFEMLKKTHQDVLRKIRQEDHRLHDVYFDLLTTAPENRTAADSIAGLIGRQRQAIELSLFDHFVQLRGICDSAQKQRLNSIIGEIARRLSPRPENNNPPPRF